MSLAPTEFTLIDQLLADQNQLQTPVATFAENKLDLEENFKTLIPLSKPGKDEQYAFQVELDKCTGCKACVSACHSLNGLDEEESWRDVGTILGGNEEPTFQQTITTACHHCESPECMHGCPVGAYDKDSSTGIVRHLDDQCIGCSYCILKCPYDVPKYSAKRGIVRKCDMCHDRLAEGEAPACVQACPTEAIKIVTVPKTSKASIQDLPRIFPSGAFGLTKPTTRYIGRDVPETALPADQAKLVPEHAHTPLIAMLTLTQIGCGLLLLPVFLSEKFLPTAIGTGFVFAGLGIGALHLGQPLKVWRFFLGLKTSWLSREFAVFGLLTAIAPLLALLTAPIIPNFPMKGEIVGLTTIGTALTALAAVFTSIMLYADTGRALWSQPRSTFRFYSTVFAACFGAAPLFGAHFSLGLIGSTILIVKVIRESSFQHHAAEDTWSPDQHSARLIDGPLKPLSLGRKITATLAILALPVLPAVGLVFLILSELLERSLFFTAVQAPKMPGNF